MIIGWIGVLITTLILAIMGTDVSVGVWIGLSMIAMVFLMIADVPAVFLADKFAAKIPTKFVHRVAAALFLALGLATLLSDFELF